MDMRKLKPSPSMIVAVVALLKAGDAISLIAQQSSGGDLATQVNAGQPGGASLTVAWIGP